MRYMMPNPELIGSTYYLRIRVPNDVAGLALRAAFYAADKVEDRPSIFKAVRDCYDLGSKAVHSGAVEITPNDQQSVKLAQNAVRVALIKQIEGDTPDFDALILGAPLQS